MTCHAEKMRQLDRLDDLRRAVPARTGRIEQIGVGANAGQRQPEIGDHLADHPRMRIETERRRKAVLGPQRRPVVIVRQVGVIETELADEFELPAHAGKRLDQSKTTNLHEPPSTPQFAACRPRAASGKL